MTRLCPGGSRLLLVLALGICVPGLSVGPHAETMAEVATLSGPDRIQKLVAGAKQEGTVTVYSSAAPADMSNILASFERTYGIKVKIWRGSSEDIRQRSITEMQAGRYDVDVVETAGPDIEAIQREGLLQEVRSPTLDDLVPGAIRPHREWVTSRISVYTAAYNTNAVRAAEAPKAYTDLLDPKWKGRLGIEADDGGWFMTYAGVVGEDKAVDLFRRIVQANGMSVRKGHTLLANLVVSGEVPLALTVYGYKADELAHAGAPLMPFALPPVIALPTGIGVAKHAPHPFAAALFWEHFLTAGQKILADQDNVPSNRKVKEPPPGLVFVDSARLLDEGDRWTSLFRSIFLNQAR